MVSTPPERSDCTQSAPGVARHAVVFCAALGGFVDLYCTQAIYPALDARFALSVAGAGALVTITTLVLAVFAPFAGWVSGRAGAKRAMVVGLAGLTLCTLAMAFVEQADHLMAVRVLQGAFIPVVLASVLGSNQAHASGAGALALAGTYVFGTVIGGVLGRLLPAALLPVLGWRDTFVVFAAVHAALFMIVAGLYAAPAGDAARAGRGGWHELRSMPRRRVSLLGLAGFSLLFGQTATFTYIAIRLASPSFGWTSLELGAIYLVFLPSLLFVRLSRRLVERAGVLAALKGAAAVGWCGLLMTLADPGAVVLIVAGLVVFASGVFVCQSLLAHLVAIAAKEDGSPVAGIYLGCYYLGAAAGAIAPALIWTPLGWPGCVGLVALVQVSAALCARALARPAASRLAAQCAGG